MTAALLTWLFLCCATYDVDPSFALAVATVESRLQCGPLGKGTYYGPFGIHKDFLRKWPIDEPRENIKRGVMALRGKDKLRILRRYNKASTRAYEKAVMAKMRELKRKP